jgi:signal transduction histidine kinase
VAGVPEDPEDYTPRHRVERGPSRLRVLADFYPDGILGASRDGVVTILNAQGAALLGVDAHEALGMPLPEVLRLLDQDGQTWLDVNRPFDSISIVRGVPEQSWLNASGEEVLTTARLVREDPLGPVAGLAVGLRSGRGRARLDRERSDLVATVAHELRSPLTGVKGFVQALLNRWDKLSDAQRKLMLTTVSADADRLARLIAELLDVARIDTGRLQLYPRPSSAAVLAGRVVQSIEAGTSREIHLDVAEDLPEVFADPDKFTQVLTNLVENAVRHGEGRVTVTLRPREDEVPGVRVTVDDEGEGIPTELHRRVFTKFWTTGESGGSGLGMYIVGGLARAHGGRVTISEAPGGGARVCVDWPSEDLRPE